jgi:hypothetical protein
MGRLRNAPLLFAAAVLTACNDYGFENFEEITKLRTLGIAIEPPEAGPGDTAVLSALAVEPRGGPVELTWEICLFTQGPDAFYACAEDEDGTAGIELGIGETVSIPYDLLVASGIDLRAICDALDELDVPSFVELPDCEQGLDVTVRLTARANGDEEIAIRPLTLLFADEGSGPPPPPDEEPNRNPRVLGLVANDVPLDGSGAVLVSPDAEGRIRLQALVNSDDAQPYTRVDDETGERVDDREQLAVTWFSTAGRLRRGQTFFAEGIADATELQFNTLRTDRGTPAAEGDEVGVWVVVRDNRGGTGWGEYRLRVGPRAAE